MIDLCMFIFSTLLFFIISPSILFTIPSNSSKKTIAILHALVFSIIWNLTHKCLCVAFDTTEIEGFFSFTASQNMRVAKAKRTLKTLKANKAFTNFKIDKNL